MLASYFIAGALFGPSCHGGTAFSITTEAIAQRLAQLGCAVDGDVLETLRPRAPAAFPTT